MTRLEARTDIANVDAQLLRQQFAVVLQQQQSLASAAVVLGQCSDTPSTAFFFAYQLAVRHLDECLQDDEFAAFAASESGVRSSRDYTTQLHSDGARQSVSGVKSHVMLMASGLIDYLYVLANDAEQHLYCVKVASVSSGVLAEPIGKAQPFVCDVPHTPIRLDAAEVVPGGVTADAHKRCFKPFRYWEDVMVLLAFSGWMVTHADDEAGPLLHAESQRLIDNYERSPGYYQPETFSIMDGVITTLQQTSSYLSDDQRLLWQRDSRLLQLGSAARAAVQKKLTG